MKILCYCALFLVELLSLSICQGSQNFQYAVQVKPVTFLVEPKSTITSQKSSITLTCQARVAPLVHSATSLPSIKWRFDEAMIVNDNKRHHIITNTSIGLSQLTINNLTVMDAGRYQCIASDANGRYITISKPAIVTVLSTDLYHIPVKLHQPVLLDCPVPVNQVSRFTWSYKNKEISSSDEVYLFSNGSLLIFDVTNNEQGVWQCHVKLLSDNIIDGTRYYINVSKEYYTGSPLVYIDLNTTHPQLGHPLTLVCLISTPKANQVKWLHNNHSLSMDNQYSGSGSDQIGYIITYVIDYVTLHHVGKYACHVTLPDGEVMMSSTIEIAIKSTPTFLNNSREQDIYVEADSQNIDLYCSANSHTSQTITWFKNGHQLSLQYYNTTTGHFRMNINDDVDHNIFGIYQCFIENELGIDYIVIRVLVLGLSNPPGNLTVILKTSFNINFHISWTPPIQRGGVDAVRYKIRIICYDPFYYETRFSDTNSYDLLLLNEEDCTYYVLISIVRAPLYPEGLSANVCVDTKLRYYFKKTSPPNLNCKTGNVSANWIPPGSNQLQYPAQFVTIKSICLNENENEMYVFSEQSLSTFNAQLFADLTPGTVCQIFGQYRPNVISTCVGGTSFNPLNYMEIPQMTCQVPVTMERDNSLSLNVTSRDRNVSLSWEIEHDVACSLLEEEREDLFLEISGLCQNKEQIIINFTRELNITSTGGVITFLNIPVGSICSFSAIINGTNISDSVQNIVGEAVPAIYHLRNLDFSKTLGECMPSTEVTAATTLSVLQTSPLLPAIAVTTLSKDIEVTTTTTLLIKVLQTSPAITGGAKNFTVTISVLFVIVIFILMTVLIIMTLLLFWNRKRRKQLQINIFNSSPLDTTLKWDQFSDNFSIKTDIQSIYLDTLPSPQLSVSTHISDMFTEVEITHKFKETASEFSKGTCPLTEINTEEDSGTSPLNSEQQLKGLNFDSSIIIDDSGCDINVQVATNGRTFQVDNQRHFNNSRDTSACSSGYGGSDVTASSVVSTSQSNDYHVSLEADLIEAEKELLLTEKLEPPHDCFATTALHTENVGTGSEARTDSSLPIYSVETDSPESNHHANSWPSLATCIVQEDTKESRLDDEIRRPIITSRTKIYKSHKLSSSHSVVSLTDSLDNSSITSTESLSSDKSYVNCQTPVNVNDVFSKKTVYEDEKGYIRFIQNDEQSNMIETHC